MIRVYDLAHSRAGDKSDTSNISVIAYDEHGWEVLREQLTVERVMFAPIFLFVWPSGLAVDAAFPAAGRQPR